MGIPLPSEISQSLAEKLYDMDDAMQKKLLGDPGNSLPIPFDKKLFMVSATSLMGMIGTAALGIGGTVAVLATPIGPAISMGFLAASATSLVGSAVLGAYHKLKNSHEQYLMKSEVLKQQYGMDNVNELQYFSNLNKYDFYLKFKDAIYDNSVKEAIDENRISRKLKTNISSLREKFLGDSTPKNKHSI